MCSTSDWRKKIRIALVISQTKPISSGVARIAERMEIGLRELGCEVDVYSPSPDITMSHGEYRLINSIPLFKKMLDQNPYEIINIHGPVPTLSDVLLLLCRANRQNLGGARIVYTHHWDIDISRLTTPLEWVYNKMTRLLIRNVEGVIVSSQSYYDDLVRFVPASKIRIIPWGVDNCFIFPTIPKKSDKFTILSVGQLRPYKGIDILLKASVHLEDCDVIIVVDGYCREKYSQLIKSLNIRNVTFKGGISDEDLKDLYATSHVIVLPSISRLEAFGIVLLEGMGAGCVPVASDLPGVIDTIGDSGFKFRLGDPICLAGKLELLKTDKQLLLKFSRKAWIRAQDYSWDETCRNYFGMYSELFNSDRKR